MQNALLSTRHKVDGRRLNTAKTQLSIVLRRQRPCSIDSYNPITLRSGLCRRSKILIFSTIFQMLKAFFDRLVGNRRDPQSFNGLLYMSFLDCPTSDQLPFSPSICGNDNFCDVVSIQQTFNNAELPAAFTDNLCLHFFRNNRQILQHPVLVFIIVGFRGSQFDQVAKGPCHNYVLSFQIAILFFMTTQNSTNFFSHRGLLSQYQLFSHIFSLLSFI